MNCYEHTFIAKQELNEGNIKVLITKRFKEKHVFAKRKSYILYIIEKSFRKCTHWFYRFKLKYFNINSND